ncbi:MAG: PorT family protein, partial [Sphingobacteriales bacterium]
VGAMAQSEMTAKKDMGFKWGVTAGASLNQQLDQYSGETTYNQGKVGFYGGFQGDWMLNKNWSIQPGLIYTMKGGQQERNFSYTGDEGLLHEVQVKNKNTLSYVQIPVDVVYKIHVGESGAILVGVGGYGSTLIGADSKYTVKNEINGNAIEAQSDEQHRKISLGNKKTDELKRFDAGLTGVLGFELSNGLVAKAGIDLGLMNIVNSDNVNGYVTSLPSTVNNANASLKNIGYTVGVSYMFK